MQYVDQALDYADKSTSTSGKRHGAVCVSGGRVISGGCNSLENPHWIKVREECIQV